MSSSRKGRSNLYLSDFILAQEKKPKQKNPSDRNNVVCSFYASGKTCKFGNDCKYLHSSTKPSEFSSANLNPKKSSDQPLLSLSRERGKVLSVNGEKGFGFILPSSGGKKVFYHMNEVENHETLREKDEVEYSLVRDRVRKDEFNAVQVKLLGRVKNTIEKEKEEELPLFMPSWMKTNQKPLISKPIESYATMNDSDKKDGDLTKLFQDKRDALQWLEEMSKKDGEFLILHFDQLEAIMNKDELPFSVIQPLLSLLSKDSVRSSDRTDKIYEAVLNSKFWRNPRNLRSYILKLAESKMTSNEISTEFEIIINLILEIVDRLHATDTELPIDALHSAAQKINGQLSSQVWKSINHLLDLKEQKKVKVAQQFRLSEWTPEGEEEDFRNIPIFPSADEILSIETGQLSSKIRPNIVDGKYQNIMHYLDTHFRLLREDCIQPLREGIKAYIATKDSTTSRDIRVYHNVKMQGLQCSRNGIVYRISFELDCQVVWETSKRLIYGTLLCLSSDDFKTMIWATVVNRDVAMLKTNKQIDIRFPSGYEANFIPENVYTMVESSATYFEAYQHVLRALQALDIDTFPLTDYLIACKSEVEAPSYLKATNTYNMAAIFDDGILSFPILQPWPKTDIVSTLDESQMESLQQALTKELAVIQGPPGTGKTFVGLKVIRALLDNHIYRKQNPILVICYTNHALDQFLEGILEFEDNIVRIGSRSKSEPLREKNLRKLMYESRKGGMQHHRTRFDINQHLEVIKDQIETSISDLNKRELDLDQVKKVATAEQISSLLKGRKKSKIETEDILKFWLKQPTFKKEKTNFLLRNSVNYSEDEEEQELDDEVITQMQLDRMVGEEEAVDSQKFIKLREGIVFSGKKLQISEKIALCQDVWSLDHSDRQRLYTYWLAKFLEQEKTENILPQLCQKYEELCEEKRILEEELQIDVLNRARVIGLTTTGMAKFQRLIQAVAPEVIIVEEAAEVLEAHIIVSLSPSTKHLILIGDHEQLRPSNAVYQLSVQFNLDISLFERLVRNGIEQKTLLRQRRMRPTISALIKPIYPKLENHPYVTSYPNVKGVSNNVFFLHHTNLEVKNEDSMSKSNPFEFQFLTKFCNYLLLQGYKSEQITVLSAYSAQIHLLRKEFRKMDMAEVRITSIDNYQGEENDIILLSLVRSNKVGEIGFLKASNRSCVALSRARIGFFCIGNAELLSRNDLWKKVINLFKSQNCFGTEIILECQNHPGKLTKVSTDLDFQKVQDGGCNKLCSQTLNCGHICPLFCHPFSHENLQCYKPCARLHAACKHSCPKRCCEDCGNCEILVKKRIEKCGHEEMVPCYLPSDEYRCSKPCEKFLPCQHRCPRTCGENCSSFCHELVERKLICGHISKMECSQTNKQCIECHSS